MNPRIEIVKAQKDFTLHLIFKNKEERWFDMKPYLNTGVFKRLQNLALFLSARAEHGTVVWTDEIDFDPDTLYLESKAMKETLLH
jgi:hypothetical protein